MELPLDMVSKHAFWYLYLPDYYYSANRIQNIYCIHCSELLLLRCINLIIGDTKHLLIPSVYVLSDIFYVNLA